MRTKTKQAVAAVSRPINAVWACCITVSRYTTKAKTRYITLPSPFSGTASCIRFGTAEVSRCVQVCGGIRSKHLTSSDLAEVPPESIPNGEFKVRLPCGPGY